MPAKYKPGADGQPLKPLQPEPGTGIEQVTLDFSQPGRTIATNSLGQQTVFTHRLIAGQPRLAEVRGAGCAHCPGPNERYGYDQFGRMNETTRITASGEPVQTIRQEVDLYGRTTRVNRIDYTAGKPQPPRLQVRFEYPEPFKTPADATAPSVIARPSLMPGQEHVVRVDSNDAGQPLRVTESGFSPVDGNGRLNPAPISRIATYTYSRINGRSVLAQVDGPLPNGTLGNPSDSDITRAVWDADGNYVIGWTSAGNFHSAATYDATTGLIAKVKNAQGAVSEFVYGSAGQLVRVATSPPGWTRNQIHSIKHDALGRSTEVGHGSDEDNSYRAQSRHEFDVAERLVWSATALGMLQHNRYDTEGRLIESGRYSGAMAQVQTYAYDAQGRITQIADNKGATLRIGYDDHGRPRSLTDALGRVHESSGSQADPAPHPRALKLRDDFGRVVVALSPDSGASIHRFDEADRLIAATDAQGNVAAYEYDVAGRIARQRITDKRTGQATDTRWRYAGKRLVALEHPTQSERHEHDERGLLVAKAVTVHGDHGSESTSVTRYRWDDNGVLQGISLPDGSHVQYQRNGQGQVIAVERNLIQTSWLQWLLPAKTLVTDLQRDIVGLKSYSTGNGIQARVLRSREGALARIVYRNTRQPTTSVTALRIQDILGIASAQAAASAASAPTPPTPQAEQARLPGALSHPADPQAFIDTRYLWDAQGNLLYSQAKAGHSAYAYDARDRLIVANADATTSRYHYDASGRRVLSQEGITTQDDLQTQTRKALYQEGTHRWVGEPGQSDYDAAGQPSRVGQREYVWDATGRLIEVRQEDRTLARYRYSHRGERIGKTVGSHSTQYLYDNGQLTAEMDQRGRITRQYVYLADQPIVVIDTPQGRPLAAEEAGTLQRVLRDLRIAVSAWFGSDERIAWLHTNHLGAVEAATNEQGQLVWQASYEPFGGAHVTQTNFVLNLRLPGQYEDAETGLHYNKHRYYDPRRGEYLSPDPLGTPDGPNGYAYVNYNPLRYIDPEGLVLFAFDGTENTDVEAWLTAHDSSQSNVVRFRDAYIDGRKRYVTGVGTDHANRDDYGDIIAANFTGLGGEVPDSGGNYSGPTRIERMLLYFAEEANAIEDNEVMQIDIVGFSRGAAQARDFANRLAANTKNGWYQLQIDPKTLLPLAKPLCQRVNFRFMGLWDTVLSTNRSGTAYSLGIPAQFGYVAQAVALNEYRSAPGGVNASVDAIANLRYWDITRAHLPDDKHYGGFPLESIGSSSNTPGRVRIERGFIGAHADIGGGYGGSENGLASVALSWMVAQAQFAGVKMNTQRISIDMNNPVIHDQSNALRVGNPLTTPNFEAPNAVWGTHTYTVEDRAVNGGRGGRTQRTQTFGGPAPDGSRSMTNADTHPFINYTPRDTATDTRTTNDIPEIRNLHNRTGTVDMQSYMSWLRQHGYVFVGDRP